MKNKSLIIVLISSIIVVIVSILHVFNLKNIDNILIDTTWYNYDYVTGNYNTFNLSNGVITYNKPTNDNISDEYNYCNVFKYNKVRKTIALDCGPVIKIKKVNKDNILLSIDNKDYKFFKDYKESKLYEFNNYFGYINDYNKKTKQALEIIEINQDKLLEINSDKEYSKIIFYKDDYSCIEYALLYDIIEKWISYSKDVYSFNINNLDNAFLEKLTKKNNMFSNNINDYKTIYPVVYVVKDNKVIDKYDIICSGFNCSMYYNK